MIEFVPIIEYGLPLLAAGLSFIALYRHFKAFSFWRVRGVVGPQPWPFLGTNIYYIFKSKIDLEHEWFQRYGKTFGIYEGYWPTLRTIDNELIQHVWVKDFSNFTDRNGQPIYGEQMKRWLLWSRGEHWSSQRALITPCFSSMKIKSMFCKILDCVQRCTDEVDSRFEGKHDTEAESKKSFTAGVQCSRDELMSMSLDVLATSVFSIKLDTYRDKESEFYKRAFAFASFDFLWFLMWLFIPRPIASYFQLDMIRYSKYEFFDKLSQKTIDERRAANQSTRNDFIQALLEARLTESSTVEDKFKSSHDGSMSSSNSGRAHGSAEMKRFNDIEIRAQMTFLFMAGFETTSNTLSFCFFELANQPDVQRELYEEVSSIKTEGTENLTCEEVLGLSKLDAFVKEVMRLYSTLTERNRVVTAKGGATLPTEPSINLPHSSTIAISSYELHRWPGYWSEPEKFDMTRFYPENRHKIISGSYIPFGIGPRDCIGKKFALLTMKTALARFLLKYKISPSSKTQHYPAKEFKRHAFILQLVETGFILMPR